MTRARHILRWTLPLAAAAVLAAAPADAAAAEGGRYIVVYDRDVASVDRQTDSLERRRGFRSRLRFRRAVEGFAAQLSAEQVRELRGDPAVEAVVPDRPVEALAAQPLASGEVAPTGVRRIGAAAPGWVREAADAGVAVLDTGVDLGHPDLDVADGTDCVVPGTPAEDDNGHGTHVAGIVGARNSGAGVTGVAPGTRVHAVKVLGADGKGLTSHIVCGIDWVVANAAARGIRVINMSLGGGGDNEGPCSRTTTDPMHLAICRAAGAGILTVAAAGNAPPGESPRDMSANPPILPATFPEVLAVTAMSDGDGAPGALRAPACRTDSSDDAPAPFSNFTRSDLDKPHTIAAPGVCIRSTWPRHLVEAGYRTLSGTSMAAPHVAAAVALCIGEAGVRGPCADMTTAQTIAKLRADAAAFRAATPDSGFAGEPSAPLASGNYYGYLLRPVLNGPQTTLTAGPPETTDDSTPSFEFGSPTPGTRFECSLDGGAWTACSSPHTTAELPDGRHELAVRALDVAETADATPATDSFTVDAVPDPPPPAPDPAPAADPASGATGDAGAPPPPAPEPLIDAAAPLLRLSLASRQRIGTVSRKGLSPRVSCSEPCRLDARVLIAGRLAKRLGLSRGGTVTAGRTVRGPAAGTRTVTIRVTSAVRRRLAGAKSVLVQVRLVATDAAGNARTLERAVRLVR